MNQTDSRVKSFQNETTEQLISQIDQIDPTIKREVLSTSNEQIGKFDESSRWSKSPEPVYTFGAPRTPTFQIRSSPKVKRQIRGNCVLEYFLFIGIQQATDQ